MSAEDQDAIQEDIPVQDAEYQQDLGQTSTVPTTVFKTRCGKAIYDTYSSSCSSQIFVAATHSTFPTKKSVIDLWTLPFGMIVRPFARQNRRNV